MRHVWIRSILALIWLVAAVVSGVSGNIEMTVIYVIIGGDPKGAKLPFGTRLCEAKCSVLYLLSRLAGKMRVSPDGNARFARQENGQVFANGDEQKLDGFGSDSRYIDPKTYLSS